MMDNYNILFGLMEALGKKWIVPLLLLMFLNEYLPFSKIKKHLSITSRALSKKLKMLESLGFIERINNGTQKVCYTLSEKGKEVTQKLIVLNYS